MEYRILGPVEARDGDRVVFSGNGKPAAVLALLLLQANEVVSVERLVDDLWGEHPPRTATKSLQTYVSQLRRALGADAIETEAHGYRLSVEPSALDSARFEALASEGESSLERGDSATAADVLRTALELWRGPAAGQVRLEPWSRARLDRLEEERLHVLELRIEADLELGRHAGLVAELQQLTREHPLREHLLALLMIALYRCGRQADALDAYRSGRQRLGELGIDPSPELRTLEQRILRHDPSLEPPARDRLRRVRASRSARVSLAAAVAIVLAAVAAGLLFGLGSGSGGSLAEANMVALIDSHGGLDTQIPVGDSPAHMVSGGGFLWTSNEDDGTVSRVDTTGKSVETIAVGRDPEGLEFADGFLWVALGSEARVAVVDPRAGKVVGHVRVGSGPLGLAARGHELWVTNSVDGTLSRVDTRSWRLRGTIPVGPEPTAVAAAHDGVWVTLAGTGEVVELDRDGRHVIQAIKVGNDPVAIAIGGGRVWVANAQDHTISRVDRVRGVEDGLVSTEGAPTSLAAREGTVWATLEGGRVAEIDARSARVHKTSIVGGEPAAVTAARSGTWVATLATPESHRGGTLRVDIDNDVFACRCVEPLEALPGAGWQLLDLAYDGLVAYRRVGGPGGGVVVPDLARSVPRPADGGRTYVFRLRRGVRFADGRPVRPSDVRASFLRFFRIRPETPIPLYTHIVGASECSSGARCTLPGVVADDRAGTVTFHLTSPDPEFLNTLALPYAFVLPAATPTRVADDPVPGTGPYRIAASVASKDSRRVEGRFVLIRNPRFKVFAPDAAPDGFPDRIVAATQVALRSAVAGIEARKADVVPLIHNLPPQVVRKLAARYASQLHVDSIAATEYLFLNTRVPPFDRVDVRRALNDAVDRARLVGLLGGRFAAKPTCQILPPGLSGYQPYCPYGRAPSPEGTWNGPDLARARSLVARSGTKGMLVQVWSPPHHIPVARYFAGVLRELGYRARTHVVPGISGSATPYYEAVGDARTRAQAGWAGWAQDYASAADFMPLFDCAGIVPGDPAATLNLSRYCSPALERRIDEATRRQEQDPAASGLGWAAADRTIVDQAPAVPYANDVALTLVSRRVGNYESNPQWGALLDQLWVR